MIYYVEDDEGIRELVVYTLQNTGFQAVGFENGQQLFSALQNTKPQLILLDIMLPGDDGMTILRRLRSDIATRKIPVIMITAKGSEYDKVIGLDSGADDYVTKPFGMMELVSRIRAVLRRTGVVENHEVYSYKSVVLDTRKHSVTVKDRVVDLTLKEFELLKLLMKNAGAVLTRDMLLENIWGYDFDGETRTVDVHIRTLRQKLSDEGKIIETVRGVGYRLGGTE
ncbi:MAG: response regulator transcription factor [Clostridiales bacterium]|jgi:two-component system alkaline phosphatase synthesis response regulator PhoP|nr:response regulator transcription factor [Clostridiales bacterium]HZJ57635.1 response regulator transcription factor [Clostridia bacterium]